MTVQLPPDYTLISLEQVGSTNDEAAKRLLEGAAARTVITATQQTAGRGRYGRTWTSQSGNLFASVILKPAGDSFSWGQIGFVISLAIAEGLKTLFPQPIKIQLKWPNDVLVEGKKIAGVLLEIKPDGKGADNLIVGFGVNIALHPEGAEVEATDLAQQGLHSTPHEALEAIIQAFEARYALWQQKGFPGIREPWLALARDFKKEIVVRYGTKEIKGVFEDIGSDDGALYIIDTDGQTQRVAAGDVYFNP